MNLRFTSIAAGLAALACAAASASAAITLSWVPVTPTATALSDSSAVVDLSQLKVYDLVVTQTAGDDWLAASIKVSGNLFLHPDRDPVNTGDNADALSRIAFGSGTGINQNNPNVNQSIFYSTAVQAPRYTTTPAPASYRLVGATATIAPTSDVITSVGDGTASYFAADYFDTASITQAGSYTILRLAFFGSNPTVTGLVASQQNNGALRPVIPALPSQGPTLSLAAAASGTADFGVSGHGGGYEPAFYAIPTAEQTAGTTTIGFSPAGPGTVLVALDFSGDSSAIGQVIAALGLSTAVNPVFGAGFDAQITLDSASGSLFDLTYDLTGSGVTLLRVAAIPEPSALGFLALAALPALRRRRA